MSGVQAAQSAGHRGVSWPGGDRFEALANLAHELRTPVQVLLGYIDLLRDRLCASQSREIVERMNSNIHALAQSVENLMEFATCWAGAEVVTEEDIDLDEFFAELMPAVEASNQDKGLEIAVETAHAPQVIRSCRRSLRAILSNLALNAVKFTAHGSVTIACRQSADRSNGCAIELEVRDTGPGISLKMADLAFERFTQLSRSTARCYRGTGLGLAVVRRNVCALGARLELKTAPGRGSSFTVTVPCTIVRRRSDGSFASTATRQTLLRVYSLAVREDHGGSRHGGLEILSAQEQRFVTPAPSQPDCRAHR